LIAEKTRDIDAFIYFRYNNTMSDAIGDRLNQLAEAMENCYRNDQPDAANILRYEAKELLESAYSDSRISQNEAGYDDTK
jgi:hypothetical protein